MSDRAITLHAVTDEDLDDVESLLAANGLPTADLRATPATFVIALDDSERVGVGGVEVHGTDGLLRSVVVAQSHRGEGYGTALCTKLESRARARGIETLYLLTTTAATFFKRHGYEEIEREAVPPQIQQTTEFSELCPESAICLRKSLSA